MTGFSCAVFYAVGLVILAVLTSKASAISCYVCNSEFDPSCGDPFKPYTIGVLNCSLSVNPDHIAGQEAKLCRKIVQKTRKKVHDNDQQGAIHGVVRVYRSCGYIEDPTRDDKECTKRSGTHDVHVDYCSCTGDLCNGTTHPTYNIYTIIISAVFGLYYGMHVTRDRRCLAFHSLPNVL